MTDAERNLLMTVAMFMYGSLKIAPPDRLELHAQYRAVLAEQDANGKDS